MRGDLQADRRGAAQGARAAALLPTGRFRLVAAHGAAGIPAGPYAARTGQRWLHCPTGSRVRGCSGGCMRVCVCCGQRMQAPPFALWCCRSLPVATAAAPPSTGARPHRQQRWHRPRRPSSGRSPFLAAWRPSPCGSCSATWRRPVCRPRAPPAPSSARLVCAMRMCSPCMCTGLRCSVHRGPTLAGARYAQAASSPTTSCRGTPIACLSRNRQPGAAARYIPHSIPCKVDSAGNSSSSNFSDLNSFFDHARAGKAECPAPGHSAAKG